MGENDQITFGDNFVTVNNQNLEEAEELEDRKRREEEIQNLLTHAMGDFNFDDQSTVTSLVESEDESNTSLSKHTYGEQYREANGDEQLKVLYEVRVREVMSLNEQVQKLKLELNEQEQQLKKKVTLLTVENEQRAMSLKEAQNLLVDKTEHIQKLQLEVENMNAKLQSLENQIAELQEEQFVLRQLNLDLEQQVVVMEKGFPLHSKVNDRELVETQRKKIDQLEMAITKTREQAEYKEKQHKDLVKDLTESLQAKHEDIIERNIVIDNLTENYEYSQNQCRELQRIVDELREKLNRSNSPLGEELKKIREFNEKKDLITETVKKTVTQEFQDRLTTVISENKALKETLEMQQQQLKDTQHNLELISCYKSEKEVSESRMKEHEDKLNTYSTERDALQNKLKQFEEKFQNVSSDKTKLIENLKLCEKQRDSFKAKYEQLTDENTTQAMKNENELLRKKSASLECYIDQLIQQSTVDRSVQVSNMNEDNAAILKLQEKLLAAHNNIENLEERLKFITQENLRLKTKVNLEQEREHLIKKLQDKAAEFERVIFENRRELVKPESISIGTNTENVDIKEEKSLLKLKYDAILYQTEAKLRKELKQEFDEKLKKIINEYDSRVKAQVCNACSELKLQNKKLEILRERDREATMKLASIWESKFVELEKQSEHKIRQAMALKAVQDQQILVHTAQLEQEYKERYKCMNKQLQKLAAEIQHEKKLLVQSNIQRYGILNSKLKKIASSLRHGSEEVLAAEKKFKKGTAALAKK